MNAPARRHAPAILALALAVAAGSGPAQAAPEPTVPLATVRALARSMEGGRCGDAALGYEIADPLGGPPRTVRGRVRVESPDRVRLDLATGEKITLRSDGGEWLQPATRQLLRISSERAAGALQWWRVLLPESRETFREDSIAPRRFQLAPRDEAAGGVRIRSRLDARGFPVELVVEGMGDKPVTYRLSAWRFGAGRGAAAYRLATPAGFEVVDLP